MFLVLGKVIKGIAAMAAPTCAASVFCYPRVRRNPKRA
jgi:hypothetical protein